MSADKNLGIQLKKLYSGGILIGYGTDPLHPISLDLNLGTISQYEGADTGAKLIDSTFVNDKKRYLQRQSYDASWKEISVKGSAVLADCETLKGWYEAGNSINLYDLYGHNYSFVYIRNFTYDYVKARGAYLYSLTIVVFYGALDSSQDAPTYTYGIESFERSCRRTDGEIEHGIDGSRRIVVKKYSSILFEITMSGIEVYCTTAAKWGFTETVLGNCDFTVTPLTLPDGKSYYGIIVDNVSTPLIQGMEKFRRFTVKMLGSLSASDIMTSSTSSILLESYSITDNSARHSVHRTISGRILQIFSNVTDRECAFSYYVAKTHDTDYLPGSIKTLSLASFHGLVTSGRTSTPVEGNTDIIKVSANMISV